MGIVDIFSKRRKRERGENPDVFKYDDLPNNLRVQIVHIVKGAVGEVYGSSVQTVYDLVNEALCSEYGVFFLVDERYNSEYNVLNFFLKEKDVEKALDVVELSFQMIDKYVRTKFNYDRIFSNLKMSPNEAIYELNSRFKEHAIGYQFVSSELIRVDSEFLHSEVVKPVLSLLSAPKFSGVNEEFLSAHENYRHGRHKECLVECLKAFESTIKVIGDIRGWSVTSKDTAKSLIAMCFDNGLIPKYLESQFTSLRTMMESGVPTLRNRNGAHGQGVDTVIVPAYIARYVLNLTGSNIVFLFDLHSNMK